MKVRLFISHAHDEKDLALAWKELVRNTGNGMIDVWLSSDANPNGGMALGKEWRDTIYEKLSEATHVLAILSPHSQDRPWITWECGVASGIDKDRKLVPVVYSMPIGDLSGPLCSYQAYHGENRAKVSEVCVRLAKDADMDPNPNHWGSILDEYQERVAAHRPLKPLQPDVFDVWLGRFKQLVEEGRASELPPLAARFYDALGERRPADMRIHELLSQEYLRHNKLAEALGEVDFSLALLPDDLVLIHRKGLILVELGNLDDVRQLLEETFSRFPDSQEWSELAGLEGRLYRELYRTKGDTSLRERAIAAYRRAFEADPSQHYPGGQAIALAADAGDQATIDALMPRVRAICEQECEMPNASFWADFTLGELFLIQGDVAAATHCYRRGLGRQPSPSPREWESALNGIRRTGAAGKVDISPLEASLKGASS